MEISSIFLVFFVCFLSISEKREVLLPLTDDEFITSEEIALVEKMLMMLMHYHRVTDKNAPSNVFDDDEMCTICFAFPIGAIFEPCQHHSCR